LLLFLSNIHAPFAELPYYFYTNIIFPSIRKKGASKLVVEIFLALTGNLLGGLLAAVIQHDFQRFVGYGSGPTIFSTLRISPALITLEGNLLYRVKVDMTERTGLNAQSAADAFLLIDHYQVGVSIAGTCTHRANRYTGRFFTHGTANRHIPPGALILRHPDA